MRPVSFKRRVTVSIIFMIMGFFGLRYGFTIQHLHPPLIVWIVGVVACGIVPFVELIP